MYFISLVERMPDRAEEILSALAAGFLEEPDAGVAAGLCVAE